MGTVNVSKSSLQSKKEPKNQYGITITQIELGDAHATCDKFFRFTSGHLVSLKKWSFRLAATELSFDAFFNMAVFPFHRGLGNNR